MVVAELVHGAVHMLVIRTQDDTWMGQMYKKQGSEFFVYDSLDAEDVKVLGRVYSMIRNEEVKLQ